MKRLFLLSLCSFSLWCAAVRAQDVQFSHRTTAPGAALDAKGLQAVHEIEEIVYAKPGDEVRLDPPGINEYKYYRRWFWYADETDTQSLKANMSFPKNSTTYDTDHGVVALLSDATGKDLCDRTPSVKVPSDLGEFDEIIIACDQSIYANYTYADKQFGEPTLSQRVLFRVRNAARIANELAQYNAANTAAFHDTVYVTAPAGRTLRVGPEHTFLPTKEKGSWPYKYTINNFPYYYVADREGTVRTLSESYTRMNAALWKYFYFTPTWYWSARDEAIEIGDVYAGRFLEIPASATTQLAGQTVEYNLTVDVEQKIGPAGGGGKWNTVYNVCKVIVTYLDPAACGPIAEPTNAPYLDHAELLYTQNFDYNTPGSTETTYYDMPLAWEDASYGFYYHALDEHRPATAVNAPYWSEYALMNTSDGLSTEYFYRGLYNHGTTGGTQTDAAEGYFLYVDAAEKPGTALSLTVEDNGFCEGTTLWFSAYVACLNNRDDSPNIDLILQGVTPSGAVEDLTTFTTGDFVTDAKSDPMAGKWQRVVFPFKLQDLDRYTSYHLSLLCKGNSISGNDLAIDDIRIYAARPSIFPMQAPTPACVDPQGDYITTYLRVDYTATGEVGNDIYYRWTEWDDATSQYKPIANVDYYRAASAPADWQYGCIPYADYAAAPTYASLEDFDAAIAEGTVALPALGCVYTDVDDRTNVPILYIATSAFMLPEHRYHGQLASSLAVIDDDKCGNYVDMDVHGAVYVMMNGETFTGTETHRYCGNQWLHFSVGRTITTMEDGTTQTTTITGRADWLWGTEDYIAEHLEAYGNHTFDEIYDALLASREQVATPEQEAMLQALHSDSLLFFDRAVVASYLSADHDTRQVLFTAFPLEGSAVDEEGQPSDIEFCTTPLPSVVQVDHVDPSVIRIGYKSEYTTPTILPNLVAATPRVIRIGDTQLADNQLEVPVFAGGIFRLVEARLTASTDPEADLDAATALRLQPVETLVGTRTEAIHFTGISSLRAGHRYTFHIVAEAYEESALCTPDETAFTVLVVPAQVVWKPATDNAAWNSDDCWQTLEGQPAFAPLPSTSVILTPGDYTVPEPTTAVEPGAQLYIAYDIHYTPYACHDLFVPAGTTVLQQHLLDLQGRAVVEMQVPTNRWVICALPVSGAVSGDFWTPAAGEDPMNALLVAPIAQEVGTYAADRLSHEVWQSLYNKSMTNLGDENTPIVSSEWTEPLNALNTPYPAGMGVAIWAESTDGAANVTFRFPKADTEYRYFNNSDKRWRENPVETIDRSTAGRPAYAAKDAAGMTFTLSNHTPGRHFLMGNPALAYIDMSKFIAGNASVLTGKYDVLTETSQELISNVAGTSADGNDYSLLAPMRGVLLETASEASSLTLSLTPDMLTSVSAAIPSKAPARYSDDDHSLYIAATSDGFTARAVVQQDDTAEDTYRAGEDAMLVLLDEWKTPFGLYTLAKDNTPLTINRCLDTRMLPLACFAQHAVGTMTLTFTGAEAERWTLIDSELGQSYALYDGLSMPLSMPQDGTVRYYLHRADEQGPTTDHVAADPTKIYAFGEHGRLTVRADREMAEVAVYDMLGRLITLRPHAGTVAEIMLPQGVYTVRVLTDAETKSIVVPVY